MDIRQLKYFVTIVQEEQVTKAAKKLHMAQPPLSQQLKLMEMEIGEKLFDRNGKKLELTETGHVLYKKAEALLNQFEETLLEVKEVSKGVKGTLSIGSVKTCFSYIPQRMKTFRAKFPEIRFKLMEGDTYRLTEGLINREIELAIVRLPINGKRFSSVNLPPEDFVLVTPNDWDIPDCIEFKQIKEFPLLLLHRVSGPGTYELIVDECFRHGFEPAVLCECPDAAMILSLVKEGIGATIMPRTTSKSFSTQGIKIVELIDCEVQSEAALIWLEERYLSKGAVKFLETFSE
ncbi:LysR family transcriptional regulator [Bacillus sp. ISL-34]|uniref:LysR family transcriptional regulator n=1 Tax=Bacillus sp. ISL-34 TaxID=2819121 RepID=UPI001BEA6712|nr:LysR family transcriptional regulator [Bacillus sp. ISL-34]MBT2649297.1 LysR family transcriptional regulator [Bacillus sp. ISL-34]